MEITKEEHPVTSVIFDWERTMWDPEAEALFPGALELVEKLAVHYDLYIVSMASKGEAEIERRKKLIQDLGLTPSFKEIVFVTEEKGEAHASVFKQYSLIPAHTMIVDDRMIRGVARGNSVGAVTVRFQNGKFAEELPDESTGQPTYHIRAFTELADIP